MQGLDEFLQASGVSGFAAVMLGFVLFLLVALLALGFLYLVYYLLTLPLRRNERVRMFLNLVELGLRERKTPEAAIAEAGDSQDRSLGDRFLLLARLLKEGLRLSQAVSQVPRLLPPQIVAMLAAGERIGNVSLVLPACRLLLRDSVSQVRGALNYLLILSFISSPVMIAIPLVLKFKVLPSFQSVFLGMAEGTELPALTRFVFAGDWLFLCVQLTVFSAIWLLTLIYLGGPRLREMLEGALMGQTLWLDRLAFRLPWRHKRLQRDFSALLAALLEAGVPEGEAVRLAAAATANGIMRRRAEEVCARLRDGVKLTEALGHIDNAGELRWRLANALWRGNGFARALAGWHEALDAKAFQQEQGAAQVLTTLAVLVNGILVASILIAMFLPLIQLINHVSLW